MKLQLFIQTTINIFHKNPPNNLESHILDLAGKFKFG